MSRFRKRPIEVEAYQLTEKKEIKTREGTLYGYPGDWIITGIQGEQYPCGNEIFEATYNPVGCAPHSSAKSEQEIREQVLDEVRTNYIKYNDIPCPELAEKYDHICDAEYCGICILDFVLEKLRKQGEQP